MSEGEDDVLNLLDAEVMEESPVRWEEKEKGED